MCTVTFIPGKEKVFLTSNRDVSTDRFPALPPQSYPCDTGTIFYPRDTAAGGTWFGVHENGQVLVLLNGGFKFHAPAPPYRKSRGLILLDLLGHESPFNYFRAISLEYIEAFTLVIWEDENLFECRWDGERKYAKHLDKTIGHIWSSVTLYGQEAATRREKWFADWLKDMSDPAQTDVLHFHQFSGTGDSHNDLTMNRDGKFHTASITNVTITGTSLDMTYLDLLNNKTYLQPIELNKEWAARQ